MEPESITGAAVKEKPVPSFFRELMRRGCLDAGEIRAASDGFYAAAKSLADILVGQGITTFPNDRDELRDCDKFFDDWYCYAVPRQGGYVYSLFKLREQEFDAKNGLIADGDTPGVTVSFIAFDTDVLAQCLSEPTVANRKRLNQEINRVVAARGQRHDRTLKAYFLSPKAEGPYLIAELYVRHIASFAGDGCIDVPEHYASVYRKSAAAGFHGWAKSSGPAASASMRSCTLPCPAPPTPPGPLRRPPAFLPGVSPGSGSSALAATRARPGTARSSAFPRPTLPTATPAARA